MPAADSGYRVQRKSQKAYQWVVEVRPNVLGSVPLSYMLVCCLMQYNFVRRPQKSFIIYVCNVYDDFSKTDELVELKSTISSLDNQLADSKSTSETVENLKQQIEV